VRILQIASPWASVPPSHYGGAEWIVHWLCDGLRRRGHDVHLVANGDSESAVPTRPVFRTVPAGVGETSLPEVLQALEAHAAIAELRPDVIHDHSFVGPIGAPDDFVYVVTAHSAGHRPFDDYYRRVSERVSVVAISDTQRRLLPDIAWAATIPNAVDVPVFGASEAFEEPGESLLFLGRIAEEKGVHLAALAAHDAGVPLLIAGPVRTPEEHEYFDERVRPLLGDGVRYVGEAGTDVKRRLLAEARALLFPIQWDEPFGLVVAEALASGTPVVAFARGAVSELVEDGVTGFVVDDVRAMTCAIGRLDAIDRAACRLDAAARFDVGTMVDRYEELYEALLHPIPR
jgi:glycosyltransferase involved in cell wall biosynthesis